MLYEPRSCVLRRRPNHTTQQVQCAACQWEGAHVWYVWSDVMHGRVGFELHTLCHGRPSVYVTLQLYLLNVLWTSSGSEKPNTAAVRNSSWQRSGLSCRREAQCGSLMVKPGFFLRLPHLQGSRSDEWRSVEDKKKRKKLKYLTWIKGKVVLESVGLLRR